MTEHTEKDVLMKCTKCGYEEEVPRWLIDELFPNEPEENYMMHCPECDHKMIVSIPRWRSHPIHENRATESIWTEPCNPLLRATKSTKRATLT